MIRLAALACAAMLAVAALPALAQPQKFDKPEDAIKFRQAHAEGTAAALQARRRHGVGP